MRILVIGGSGLISTGITEQLPARGDDVAWFNRTRRQTQPLAGTRLIIGDRTDLPAFESALRSAGTFDAVIDMICCQPEEAASAVRALNRRTAHYIFCSTMDVDINRASAVPGLLSA